MTSKDELKRFIDDLPDGLAGEVLDFAQFVARKVRISEFNQVIASMSALPEDDEPYAHEQQEASRLAYEEYKRLGGVSAEDARRRLL